MIKSVKPYLIFTYFCIFHFYQQAFANNLTPFHHISNNTNLESSSTIAFTNSGDYIFSATHKIGNEALDNINVFSKNTLTNKIELIHSYTQSVNGIDGLTGIVDMAFSNNDQCFYTTASKFIIPFSQDGHLTSFRFNDTNGELNFVSVFDLHDTSNGDFTHPGSLEISLDDKYLYMLSSQADEVLIYEIDDITCEISFIEKMKGGTNGIPDLRRWSASKLSHDNKYLYISAWDNIAEPASSIILFEREDTTGFLTYKNSFINGTDGITGLDSPTSIDISNDGKYFYVSSSFLNTLVVFSIDQDTGDLFYIDSYRDDTNLWRPSSIQISPDQNYLVSNGTFSDSLVVFKRNKTDGTLTFDSVYFDNDNGFNWMQAIREIGFDHDGYLYTTSALDHAIQQIEFSPESIDLIFESSFE